MISDDQVAEVQQIINELYEKSLRSDATSRTKSTFLGAYFCFGDGNANRPDIATNVTCAEALAWRHQYLKYKVEHTEIPDLKVNITLNLHFVRKLNEMPITSQKC